MWKSFHGAPIQSLLSEVIELTQAGAGAIHIGTDSQIDGAGTNFVTALCVLVPGVGGRVFTRSSRQECRMSLAEKLILEAESSLCIARELEQHTEVPIVVHLDVNENPRHRSSKHVSMLAGMVRGNGFAVKLKPEAWCATHVADHVVKRHVPRAA
jgi:predicted RNase H-related nuclease YkuK (DUF458 family)